MSYKIKKNFSYGGKRQEPGDTLGEMPEALLKPLIENGYVEAETKLKKTTKNETEEA